MALKMEDALGCFIMEIENSIDLTVPVNIDGIRWDQVIKDVIELAKIIYVEGNSNATATNRILRYISNTNSQYFTRKIVLLKKKGDNAMNKIVTMKTGADVPKRTIIELLRNITDVVLKKVISIGDELADRK